MNNLQDHYTIALGTLVANSRYSNLLVNRYPERLLAFYADKFGNEAHFDASDEALTRDHYQYIAKLFLETVSKMKSPDRFEWGMPAGEFCVPIFYKVFDSLRKSPAILSDLSTITGLPKQIGDMSFIAMRIAVEPEKINIVNIPLSDKILLEAVELNPEVIKYLNPQRITKDMATVASKRDPAMVEFIPMELHTEVIVENALSFDVALARCVSVPQGVAYFEKRQHSIRVMEEIVGGRSLTKDFTREDLLLLKQCAEQSNLNFGGVENLDLSTCSVGYAAANLMRILLEKKRQLPSDLKVIAQKAPILYNEVQRILSPRQNEIDYDLSYSG